MSKRLPALDGLRVFAVLTVFGYHALGTVFPDGGIGVDVFFVISGFVITRLLTTEADSTGRIALGQFYLRRWRRLMPALALLVVAILITAAVSSRYSHEWLSAVFAGTYLMDIAEAAGHHSQLLGHTWSLGIEEQFYLLWPVVLIALLAAAPRVRAWVVGLLIVLPLLWRLTLFFGLSVSPARVYFAPDTRIDQLMIGCGIALLARSEARQWISLVRFSRWLAWPALAVLAVMALSVHQRDNAATLTKLNLTVGPSVTAICAGLVIVVLAAVPGSLLTQLLGLRWLAVAGARYSYGFYLWHYPVIAAVASRNLPLSKPAMLLASAAVSVLSYHLWEARFRRAPGRRRRPATTRLEPETELRAS